MMLRMLALLSLAAPLLSCHGKHLPHEVGASASLMSGTFTMFLVESTCARDDTPHVCDPAAAFPVSVASQATLVGTFVPSQSMCGPFDLVVEMDRRPAWSGRVPGGGEANAVGTFLLGSAAPGAHLITVGASSDDPCYGRALDSWFGTFTIAASDAPIPSIPRSPGSAADLAASTAPIEPGPGRNVFATCEPCHGSDGAGREGLNAPAIAGQEPWYLERQIDNFRRGRRGTHDKDLYGMQMRPMALELAEPDRVRAVVDYIASLPPPRRTPRVQGDTAAGRDLFLVCAVCHGENAEGSEATGAPRLTVQQDWYLTRQIKNFKDQLRGYHADDRYGNEMRVVTDNLPDDSSIRDVVAYIQTLPGRTSAPPVAPPEATTFTEPVIDAASAPAPLSGSETSPPPKPAELPASAAAPSTKPPAPPAPAPTTAVAAPAPAEPPPARPTPAKPAPAKPAPPAKPSLAGTADLADLMSKGEAIYARVCAPCHQPTGQGLPGVFPPLAGSGSFYGSPQNHAKIIINGLSGKITVGGQTYDGVMPPQGSLSNEDIAAVATYVRQSWGNNDGVVTPADVQAAR